MLDLQHFQQRFGSFWPDSDQKTVQLTSNSKIYGIGKGIKYQAKRDCSLGIDLFYNIVCKQKKRENCALDVTNNYIERLQ